MIDFACATCAGCGQVANDPDQTPWSAYATLPSGSDLAVRLGLVRPRRCPTCGGSGRIVSAAAHG
jgi:hypothetical protein